jgi:hypothetical protein
VSPWSGTEIGGSPFSGAAKSITALIRWVADNERVWPPKAIVPVCESMLRVNSGPGSSVGVYVSPSAVSLPGPNVARSYESAKSAPIRRLRLTVTGIFTPLSAIITGRSAAKPRTG